MSLPETYFDVTEPSRCEDCGKDAAEHTLEWTNGVTCVLCDVCFSAFSRLAKRTKQ